MFATGNSEPNVVSFLKLHENGQRDTTTSSQELRKRNGQNGLDFQHLFAHVLCREPQEARQGDEDLPVKPKVSGLELGQVLLRPKGESVERGEDNASRTQAVNGHGSPRSHGSSLSRGEVYTAYVALLEAIREQDDFKVQEVLQLVQVQSASPILERKDGDGNTLLHRAASFSATESCTSILSYLQHCKADLEARNVLGETPLILAVREALEQRDGPGWLGAVACLLEGRADPNAADEVNEETALMEAACYGSQDMCRLLLDFQADVSMKTASGGTAKDFASSEGHESLVKLLRSKEEDSIREAARKLNHAQGSQMKPAPFATSLGFTTWSGGLAERWSAPRAETSGPSDFHAKDAEAESAKSDFKPGLIFGSSSSSPFTNSHFQTGGYQNRSKESHFHNFPFAERSGWPQKSKEEQHFRTLGLSPQACAEEVRAAYRKLAKQYHPDKNQGSKEAAEKFREVRRAYEHLSLRF